MRNAKVFNWTAYTILSLFALLGVLPLLLLLSLSAKSTAQIQVNPLVPSLPVHWDNFVRAWRIGIRYGLLNSTVISLTVLLGSMTLSAVTAYVFARHVFPGKEFLFSLILGLMMIPGITTLMTRYILVRDLGLLNTLWAVILPGVFGANAFNIFVLRTFFASMSEELFEAARLDGAGHFSIFTRIVVPLSWPVVSSLSILQVMGTWNDYIWPMMVLQRLSLRTISVGLVSLFTSFNPDVAGQMAGSVIASIPLLILFFVAMRTFIEGLSAGAIKM